MLQHVNQVFVANANVFADTAVNTAIYGTPAKLDTDGTTVIPAVNATFTNANKGTIVIADENYNLLADPQANANPTVVYLGLVEGVYTTANDYGQLTNAKVRWSMPIQLKGVRSMVTNPFISAKEDSIQLDFTNVTPEAGHRYALRLVYRDIVEHPAQFTHTYDLVARDGEDGTSMASRFAVKVNKHRNRRVNATATGAIVTLNAMVKDDNEGLYPLADNYYSQVIMDAFMYTNLPTGLLTNVQYPITGLVISKATGTPGKGNWKIIRDHEYKVLGYRGILYKERTTWPVVKPAVTVTEGGAYDEFCIEWNNLYRSNDNQYTKDTPLALEIYSYVGDAPAYTAATDYREISAFADSADNIYGIAEDIKAKLEELMGIASEGAGSEE